MAILRFTQNIGAILVSSPNLALAGIRRDLRLLARTYVEHGLWCFKRVNIALALAACAHARRCHFTNGDVH